MSDVFGRATDAYGGSFTADGATVAFSEDLGFSSTAGQPPKGLLIQNMTVSYNQNLARLYEIGSNFSFLISGRTQGQMAMARVLGPRRISLAFYAKFGNVCNAATNNITLGFAAGCGPQNAGQAMLLRVLFSCIANLGMSMNAQDSIISENLSLMYCSLLLGLAGAPA